MPKILIVEDNADNLHVFQMALEYFGYQVVCAMDGEEGVHRAQESLPDLILMDIQMPVMDGFQAFDALRQREDTRQIPVIAITANALHADRARVLAAGFDGYLAKPVRPRDVVAEVQRRLGTPE